MRDPGTFELAAIHAVLDAQPLCTVAHVRDGKPYLTSTLQWREVDRVYWHDSSASRALLAGKGHDVCMSGTILDGFVLARSGFNHSVNARSVTLFGIADVVPEDEKAGRLTTMIETVSSRRSEPASEAVAKPQEYCSEVFSRQAFASYLHRAEAV